MVGEAVERTIKVKHYMQELNDLIAQHGAKSSSKRAKLCSKILTAISSEKGEYHAEMNILKDEIENHMFCFSREVLERIEKNFPGVTKEEGEIGQPYFQLLGRLMKFAETYKSVVRQKLEEKDQKLKELGEELAAKDAIIKDYEADKMTGLEFSFIEMKRVLTESLATIEDLKSSKKAMQEEVENLRINTLDFKKKTEAEIKLRMEREVTKFAWQRQELQAALNAKEEQILDLKSACKKYLSAHQSSIIKLTMHKDEIIKMKERTDMLETQNSKLAVRAAIGFDQLTPRPKLDMALEFFRIEKQAKMSTQAKADLINTAIEVKSEDNT